MKLLAADSVVINSSHDISNVSDMVKFVLSNEKLLCKALLEAENGKILREKLMPLVLEKFQEHFVEFASGIVGSFCLGQKQLQDVLRNKWGKYLAGVLGINIIPPKALVVENLKKKKQELTQLIGLEFEVHGDVVIAKVNVAKYLEYLLSRPPVQFEKIAPKNKILFYQFTDLAPWLKWSRYFTGITTTRVKVVECQNLSRLVINTGVYLGPDDYETVQKCFGKLYKDYGQLKEIHPANCNSPVKVFYRSCADGKQRRIDSGNSSSRSTFPIPDSPEHTSLLRNMLVISKAPVWTYENLKLFESYLSDREQVTFVNGVMSSSKRIVCGVPQGSILGPLLFLLYINDLPDCLEKSTPCLYADDTQIFSSAKDCEELNAKLNHDLHNVSQWLVKNKLHHHSAKTKLMYVGSNHSLAKIDDEFPVMINDQPIPRVHSISCLGVKLDEILNWEEHIDMVCKKV